MFQEEQSITERYNKYYVCKAVRIPFFSNFLRSTSIAGEFNRAIERQIPTLASNDFLGACVEEYVKSERNLRVCRMLMSKGLYKMSPLLVFIVFTTLPLTWTFSTQYYGNTKHAKLPNHCYYEEFKLAVPVNDTLYPTNIEFQCVSVSCRYDYVLAIKHCDRYLLRHGCIEQPPDYGKPYPDCCTQIKCAD